MKKHIKRISVLLAILMIFSSFPMASAYEYVSPDNVTYLDAGFATVGTEDWYAWTWSDNSSGRWVKGDEVSTGVYSFNYLEHNILFARVDKTKKADWNNGSVYNQTEDLVNHTADYCYVITAWNSSSSDKMQGKWEFVGPDIPPTEPTEVYYTVEPPTTDPVTEPSATTSPTTYPTEPSTENARDSLYNTYQRIRDSIPVGGTPYTRESQQRFNTALRAAKDLLDDATATDTQLRQAEQELIDAYNALEYSTADRTKLWAAIDILRGIIESGEYKNYSNADELKEIYDYALPVVYYEPDQSVIDEWEAKIYAALKTAGVITEPTTYTTYPTYPTSESTTGYTEPTEPTEDPTSHCTEFDLPYSSDFAVALANYSNNLVGEVLDVNDVDVFYYDQNMVVFGMTDMLCTVGEEDIDGYHFENWNFFPRESNKTGYCVYFKGTIYNLPDAVSNNIMTARALASVIPHSCKIDTDTTEPTMPTDITEPTATDSYPTQPPTEDPTGHCTDWEQEQLKMQFATELSSYSYELGYNEPISINEITPYTEDYRMYVFALTDNLCTESEEIINGYKFKNPNFFGNEKNKTGYCVFNGTKIYSIADAVKERIVTVEFLASILPFTAKMIYPLPTPTIPDTEPTEPTVPNYFISFNSVTINGDNDNYEGKCLRGNVGDVTMIFNSYEEYSSYFPKTLSRYDEDFFKTKSLIFLYRYENYVSTRHFITGVQYENKVLTVWHTIKTYADGDMVSALPMPASWNMFATVNKADIGEIVRINVQERQIVEQIDPTNPTDPATEPATQATEPVTAPTEPTAPATYSIGKAKVSAVSDKTYTGKAITPTIKVTYNGKILSKNKDYTLSYKNNKNVGTAAITITGKGSYTGTKTVHFKITKAANTMTVKATAKTVKYTSLKKAKQTVSAITVKSAAGNVTYKKASGSSCLTVGANGKITVKKGTKKGTYTIKVKVTAAGNKNYKSGKKTVTVKITVK